MAQSGLPTSVGLCLESSFRVPPITLLSGSNYAIGITGTNPHRFWVVEPGGGIEGTPTVEHPEDEIDGSIMPVRTILTGKEYNGSFTWKADPENLYYPLLGILGKDVQTILNASGSNNTAQVSNHVFTPNIFAPSFTSEEEFGDHNYGRVSSGVVIPEFSLDFSAIVTATASFYGHRQVPNVYPASSGADTEYDFTSAGTDLIPDQMGGNGTKTWQRTASPTYVDVAQGANGNGPLVHGGITFGSVGGNFASAYLTYTANDGTVTPYTGAQILPGLNIRWSRKVDSQMIFGSGFDKGAVTGSQLVCGGRISLLFSDTTILKRVMGHATWGLNFKVRGNKIGSTTQCYTLEVYLPHLTLLNVPVNIPDGPIIINSDFVATKDPSLGYHSKVTLINTVDNTSLGGGASTNGAAGGLGGWNNA